jgi:hypothetical protein
MPNTPDIPRELGSAYVMTRFLLRMLMLSVLSTLGSQGFGKTLESMLVLAALYCVFAGAIRREAPFGPVLTHFDEAAAYTVVARLISWAS